MDSRILIALQFWGGDQARAMELAKFLADLEPEKSKLADFLFASRFDCPIDPVVPRQVARKFTVYTKTSRRRGTGWPDGCNELWFSVMEWVQSMIQARKIPHYKAIFTCEADGCPIQRNWIEWLSLEWDRVNRVKPVVIAGPMVPPGPHINGNALITGNLKFLSWITRRVGGVQPGGGWDFVLRRDFERIGWSDIPCMKSIYNTPTFSQEQYEDMINRRWVWIHGVKDGSLIRMGREKFKV